VQRRNQLSNKRDEAKVSNIVEYRQGKTVKLLEQATTTFTNNLNRAIGTSPQETINILKSGESLDKEQIEQTT
jgi:hypothetical protein